MVLKFYSESCGPCKALSRMIDKAGLQDIVVNVDVDKEPAAVKNYNVKSVPTVIVTEGEKEIVRWTGLFNVNELIEIVNKY